MSVFAFACSDCGGNGMAVLRSWPARCWWSTPLLSCPTMRTRRIPSRGMPWPYSLTSLDPSFCQICQLVCWICRYQLCATEPSIQTCPKSKDVQRFSCGFKQRSWKDVAMGAIISMGLIGGEGKFYHWDHLSVWSYVRYVFSRAVSWSNVRLFQLFQTFAGAGTNNARLAGLLRPLSDLCEGFWTEASRIYIYIHIYSHIPKTNSPQPTAAGSWRPTMQRTPMHCSWWESLKADCIKSLHVFAILATSLPHFSIPWQSLIYVGITFDSHGVTWWEDKWAYTSGSFQEIKTYYIWWFKFLLVNQIQPVEECHGVLFLDADIQQLQRLNVFCGVFCVFKIL